LNDLVINKIAQHYNLNIIKYEVISSGLINATIKLITNNDSFILQKINTTIFNNPQAIHDNIFLLNNYLQQHKQSYTLTVPVIAHNQSLVQIEKDTFRLFHFIPNTFTIATVDNANQAYEAAKQFSHFTHQFINIDCNKLQIILPDFNHLSLRFQQFLTALKTGNKNRIEANKKLVEEILNHENICKKYEYFIQTTQAKKRVTHHDTKISNVLFNQLQKAVCVIDLDTVMPGYFISDVGRYAKNLCLSSV